MFSPWHFHVQRGIDTCCTCRGMNEKVCIAIKAKAGDVLWAQQQTTEWGIGCLHQDCIFLCSEQNPPLNTFLDTQAICTLMHRCSSPPRMHALHVHTPSTLAQTPTGKIQTGMHNKGKSSRAPQLISCMEIIFKTEQNGGPSLYGRVGLLRAPRAGWHVTVYAWLLNKRCWPRWKSAIGHLICPTRVIGSCPNPQYSCPIEDQDKRRGNARVQTFFLHVWRERACNNIKNVYYYSITLVSLYTAIALSLFFISVSL